MSPSLRVVAVWLLAGCIIPFTALMAPAAEPSQVLFDAGDAAVAGQVTADHAKYERYPEGSLRIQTGHDAHWPGITLKAPAGHWDLGAFRSVNVRLKNEGAESVTISCRVDNPGADGVKHCLTSSLNLAAGREGTLEVKLAPTPWRLSEPIKLVGMRGAPGQADDFDPAKVTQLVLFVTEPKRDHQFDLKRIEATGHCVVLPARTFLPFIDTYGQFIHADWPGKTHSLDELAAARRVEESDLAGRPSPTDWDVYGGWTRGPEFLATGFFQVTNYQSRWWLVDPAGRLFWSHGLDCVGVGESTPISQREDYFQELPEAGSPFAVFYGQGNWAPHGFYRDHSPYKTYDFSRANLLRKYGEKWAASNREVIHRRLKSWGLNTIANWSDRQICLERKTPYVCTLGINARTLAGSEGYWGKFVDVFDPSFRESARRTSERQRGVSAGDPWCLGFFVDNEIAWGSDTSLAEAALKSPADQPAKQVFVSDLKAKYSTIESLNAAWGTQHESWDALLQSQNLPNLKRAKEDLTAFYTRTAETYFRTIREELKKIAPQQLYLGCRFAWVNDRAVEASAKFCDVISFNRYEYSVAELSLPKGINLPVIIGEFHFGALDRGMFHTGLRVTKNQADRAEKYRQYVEGALKNPLIIGTHWFQYQDQATTGRGDGENYQIGFVDVADRPYPEIIQACRDIGYRLYEFRTSHP